MRKILTCLLMAAVAPAFAQVLLSEEGVENAYPRLSADGSKLLYQSDRTGKWQLYVRDLKIEKDVRVTDDVHANNFPDWSPDNQWVAFVSDRDGNEEIYLAKADGTGLKRLTNDPARDIHPYFSPDGKFLLFNSTRGNKSFDIYRYDLEKGETDRLTDTPEDETCARYSPDMKSMVFLRNNYNRDDIFISDAEASQATNVTNTPATRDGWPMFGPDGKWIFYSAMSNGRFCIYKIRPDGSERTQLTEAAEGEEHARVYVAVSGDFFIYNLRKGGSISVVKKWLDR